MSSGFMFEEILYVSKLISAHLKKERHKSEYKTDLELVRKYLKNLGAKPGLREKVVKHYSDFWKICSGLKEEELLSKLPVGMQKDVCLDINWDPIQHTHVFRHNGINFKRALSLTMKNEFLHPGDYVYRRGTINAKAIYIVSGVVQIMSELDGVSALVSFSSGTVLGGVSTVIPTNSVADIRCATYCELRTLGMRDLYSIIRHYPWELRQFNQRIFDRLREAELMVAINKERRLSQNNYFFSSRDGGFKWIKKRWRLIAKFKTKLEKKEDIMEFVNKIPIDPEYTSKYLDMIVISEEIELKHDRFCLRCRWPFVIDPASDFLVVWLIFITVLIFTESIFLPYYVAFYRTFPPMFRRFLIFMSYIYIVDLYIQFVTAVKKPDLIIVEPMALLRHKLKSFRYILEIFSTLPIGLSLWLFGSGERISSLMELLRLLKSWRVVYYIILTEAEIKHQNPKIRFFKHLFSILSILYFFACFLYLKACFTEECDPEGWYEKAKTELAKNLLNEEVICFLNSFTYSLFFSLSIGLTASITTIKMWIETDVIAAVVITIVLMNGKEYAFAEIVAITLLGNRLEQDFAVLFAKKEKFMTKHSISRRTRNCFDSYLKLQWKYNFACGMLRSNPVLSDVSRDLKAEIFQEIVKVLKTVSLFSGESKEINDFVKKNSENVNLYLLPRNMSIVTGGLKAASLNIIRKGYCRVVSHVKEDLDKFPEGVLIGPGSCFPVPELVCNLPSIITVETESECEVITVESEELVNSIRVNRSVKKDILTLVNSYTRVRQILGDANFEKKKETSLRLTPFPYTKNEDVDWPGFRLLKFVIMPYTFVPDGSIVFYWEIFRVLLAILSHNYFILYYTMIKPTIPEYCHIIGGILDFLSLSDVYFRLHVSYYNEDGVIIKNPAMIIKYYMRHSLVIDLLSSLPVYAMLALNEESDRAWFITTVLKILPIYRVINFIYYLNKMPQVNKYIPHFMSYTTFLITTMNVAANIIALHFCRFHYKQSDNDGIVFDKVECSAPMMQEIEIEKTPFTVLNVTLFIAVLIYTSTRATNLRAMSGAEMYALISGVIMGFIIRSFFTIRTIVLIFTGGKDFSEYMSHVSTFIQFMNAHGVDPEQTKSVLTFYQHVWNYIEAGSLSEVIQRVHPSIRTEVLQQMYSAKLQLVEALSTADKSFFSTLAMKVNEHYVTKGSVVCDKYHLNDNIYFIFQGAIDVIVSESIPPVIIGVGGMFGCFRRTGKLRHMFKFQARVHTHCLVINAETFFNILQAFRDVKQEFIRVTQPHKEYIEGNAALAKQRPQQTIETTHSKFYITTQSKLYQIGDYILCFVVPYLTFVFVFSYIVYPESILCPQFLYFLDVTYCIKIIAGLMVPYMDKETGLIVRNKKSIRRRYLKDSRFYCDVFSVLPVELFHNQNQEQTVYFFLNRLLKGVTFVKYINYRRLRLHVQVFTNKVDFLLLLPLLLYVLSCVWQKYFHEKHYFYFTGEEESKQATGWKAIIISIDFILSLFSKSTREGTNTIKITNTLAFMFISLLLLIENLLFSVALGWIANIYDKSEVIIADYEHKVNKFKAYLKKSDLSPSLMESAWQYVRLHWSKVRGLNLPRFLESAPYTTRTQIMCYIYGHHLENNILFKDTHPSFLIQLSARLKRTLYFPDNYIVVQGDVEHKMYFIQSGEVELIVRDSLQQEDNVGVLTVGDSFGLVQGLYDTEPHVYTFKARTEVDMLTLERDDWEDLRAAFWLDTKLIYKRARALSFHDDSYAVE